MRRAATLAAGMALVLAGCGGGGTPEPVPARPHTDPGFVASAKHELRYGTVLAAELPPQVARAYGIDRSRGRAVLNVSLLERQAGAPPQPVQAAVRGEARNLLGERRPLDFAAVLEGEAVSYVAVFEVRDREPVVLEFSAEPAAGGTPLATRITRSFELR